MDGTSLAGGGLHLGKVTDRFEKLQCPAILKAGLSSRYN